MTGIAKLTKLEVLALASAGITGEGLAKLEGMTRLNELNISNCPIQDDDVKVFLSMPNLRIIYAAGTSISPMAVRNMQIQFPMLAIFP